MASLRELSNSPFWIACYTDQNGQQTQRSTKVPKAGIRAVEIDGLAKSLSDILGTEIKIPQAVEAEKGVNAREARRMAQYIADHFEDTAKAARARQLSESQARQVISEIYELSTGEKLSSSTIKDFFESWLKRKEIESNPRTHERYTAAVRHVLDFLGSKGSLDVSHLAAKDITAIRDHLSKKLSANSANYTVKVLRAALNQARRDGLVDVNEASRVTKIKRNSRAEQVSRRAFTLGELKKVLDAAKPEWQGIILTGLYTGLRLGDIATLTWANLDLQQAELAVTTQKTGRRQVIPLAKPLLGFFEKLPAGDNPTAPLFPKAYEAKQRNPNVALLSNQFYDIMVDAGLVAERPHTKKKDGKGRASTRQLNALSFHCLRHTATSLLKNAGVSDVVARDIIGHDSPAISQQYTHIDTATKRKAVDAMPDVLKPEEPQK